MKRYEIICKVCVYSMDELTVADRKLVEAAKAATQSSYAPYSDFCVGAALRLEGDVQVIGCNQENAAFPSGLCAERTALFAAGAQYPELAVEAIAIAARRGDEFLSEPIPPCGACRQVMMEVEARYHRPMRILLYGTDGVHVVEGVSSLLPLHFEGKCMKG